jgi:hypothetical protein
MVGPQVLRLGPKLLSHLMEQYKSWNASIETFISGIKVPIPLTPTKSSTPICVTSTPTL